MIIKLNRVRENKEISKEKDLRTGWRMKADCCG